MVHAKADMKSGILTGMSAKDRADRLVNSGSPNISKRSEERKRRDQHNKAVVGSVLTIDQTSDDDEDETSYGIIPTRRLK